MQNNAVRTKYEKIGTMQLSNTQREFYYRLGYCLVVNSGLFEYLLSIKKFVRFDFNNIL